MYVGVGAKRVRELFQKAREHPSTIILIDEIDALGRRKNELDASDSERNSTLNQILTEMDGFSSGGNVLVIAATNRLEMIDPALIRAGRFDLKIQIPLPSLQDRKGILLLHLAKKKTEVTGETINRLA
jgi:cell division protease FtsH